MKLLICTQVIDKQHPILGFFHRWVEEFAKHFDRIDVICLQMGDHSLPPNVFVHSLGKERGKNHLKYLVRFYYFFFRYFVLQRVDFVFFHMGAIYNVVAAPLSWWRFLVGTKFYWWKTHGHISLMSRIALSCVDRVYTAIAESFPVTSRKRHVIGHAIDATLFVPANGTQERLLLFAGRLMPSKHVEEVIAVAARLAARGHDLRTVIIGQPTDTAYAERLYAAASATSHGDVIKFIPGLPQPALVSYYQQAKIFMNPSTNDGLDKVILEAMACGVVPLTCNRSFKTLLSPFDLYVERGDIDGYVRRAERLLAASDQEYASLATKLRSIVTTEHAIHTLPQRLFGVG